MDDPGWSWPYWKFGLKRDDLFTKLHDLYNTVPSAIQDPEAFHHDVFEISHEAVSTDDFYRLLSDRKAQRLRELNDSLESAALEIISNPSLIGTEQWQYAVQLFRTKSLDSLVRYFSSYLPDDHSWHKFDSESSSAGSISETASSVDSVALSHTSFFDDVDDKPLMTHEPLPLSTSSLSMPLPLSPRSMTMRTDDSAAASAADPDNRGAHRCHHKYAFHNLTPARTMSFSGSDTEAFDSHDSGAAALRDAKRSQQQCDAETPVSDDITSQCEVIATSEFDVDLAGTAKAVSSSLPLSFEEDEFITTQIPEDMLESSSSADDEDATPRPASSAQAATYFVDVKPSLPRRRHASTSPSRPPHPLSQSQTAGIMSSSLSIIAAAASSSSSPSSLLSSSYVQPMGSGRPRRRELSPRGNLVGDRRRRGGVGEPANRIQKPLADVVRLRSRGRRQVDG